MKHFFKNVPFLNFKNTQKRESIMKCIELEKNKTKKIMLNAFLELLNKKQYHDITIGKIADDAGVGRRTFYRYFLDKESMVLYVIDLMMDRFAQMLIGNVGKSNKGKEGIKDIARIYFLFWEEYIEELRLLHRAGLSHYIGDNLEQYIFQVAKKSNHLSRELSQDQIMTYYEKYKYAFAYRLAGYWRVTLLWCEEQPRKTPDEMSVILSDIMTMSED